MKNFCTEVNVFGQQGHPSMWSTRAVLDSPTARISPHPCSKRLTSGLTWPVQCSSVRSKRTALLYKMAINFPSGWLWRTPPVSPAQDVGSNARRLHGRKVTLFPSILMLRTSAVTSVCPNVLKANSIFAHHPASRDPATHRLTRRNKEPLRLSHQDSTHLSSNHWEGNSLEIICISSLNKHWSVDQRKPFLQITRR